MSARQLTLGTLFGREHAFSLPLATVTSTIAVLARKGRGKTYTAAVLAEELLEAGQVPVIIDPTGAHWGLKSSADGSRPGYPVVVFGGEHADLPLEEHAGETIARAVVEQRFPAIMDLSLMRKGASHRFLAAFLETLYRLNREPIHLLADEADDYAPQKPFGDEARVLGAMEDVVRRGRKKGIGCTMITQRPAVLNKNVLTQADMLVCLGMNHPRDIGAIEEWIAVHGDMGQAQKMIASLPGLPVGAAWFWAPSMDDLFEQVRIRRRTTFDSSATPKAGEKIVAPKRLAEIDVQKLGKEIADTAERAKANDPAELRRKIADLERQITHLTACASAPAAPAKEIKVPDRPAVDMILERMNLAMSTMVSMEQRVEAEVRDIVRMRADIQVAANEIKHQLSLPQSMRHPAPERVIHPPIPRVTKTPIGINGAGEGSPDVGNGGLRRILIAISQRAGLDHRQLGLRACLSSRSGTFSTYLAKARSSGWIEERNGGFHITEAGARALGSYEALPTGSALRDYWLNELGRTSGAARMLDALCSVYPSRLTAESLGEKAQISHRSGTFSTYLSKLRGLELVHGRGDLQASSELFE